MDGRWAYLTHLLVWAAPLLALQLGVLRWRWGARTPTVVRAVVPPALGWTAWLVAADHLAIGAGIWRFGEGTLLGPRLGAVPVEEGLFFLLTNLLVAFGLALLGSGAEARA